jgi:hypothetical protein
MRKRGGRYANGDFIFYIFNILVIFSILEIFNIFCIFDKLCIFTIFNIFVHMCPVCESFSFCNDCEITIVRIAALGIVMPRAEYAEYLEYAGF